MAILIDMDMPQNCGECINLVCSTITGEVACVVAGKVVANDDEDTPKNRPDWCPLREVVRCRECKSYIKVENESEAWELCNHGMVSIHSVGGDEFCSRGERREE